MLDHEAHKCPLQQAEPDRFHELEKRTKLPSCHNKELQRQGNYSDSRSRTSSRSNHRVQREHPPEYSESR
ncbi:hypothetical protein F2Q68_00003690 [Brassica cretica]|uniref:Uncharacterized protein n=1 Tax=Brassica cretica TaxID=69181 RepID=A0A8S9J5G1_BRACR|nr:hypothetical protein F2Q68_00003690 [Brassica cretica]